MPANNEHNDLPGLSEENHRYLREVAADAVRRHVEGKGPPELRYDNASLKGTYGVFVTLKVHGELRGCIGNLMAHSPLPEAIAEMAVKSASSDPRFPPLGISEIDNLEFDISILGPLREVENTEEIQIGLHGLVVEYAGRHGLLLPQVATEHGLDVPAFISQTCIKAGLPPDTWKHGAKIYKFAAEVF